MASELSLKTPSTGLVTLSPADTATDKTITLPATTGTMVVQDGTNTTTINNLAYTGTLTGGTGVVNIGSGQVYKDASGNVGIGYTTPYSKLHVNTGGNTASGGITLRNGANQVHNWYLSTDTTSTFEIGSGAGAWNWSNGGGIRMTLNSSGNLGIGNTGPIARLHVTSAPATKQVLWSDGTNGTGYMDTVSGASRIYTNVALAFGTASDTFSEKMRINTNGDVLVGKSANDTTNPGIWLYTAAGTYGRINLIKGTASGTGATPSVQFYYNGTAIGSIGNTSTATAYNTSSDYRLKENVAPMTGALATVAQLKPCTYTWKVDGSLGQGFIAHELQAIVPDAVTGQKDAVDKDGNPEYQGVDTSFLVATLVSAIQELTARLEVLENK